MAGKPIVVTNYMTVRDVIKDGEDGMIADFTPESVAEKIMMIIEDKSLRDTLQDSIKVGIYDELVIDFGSIEL